MLFIGHFEANSTDQRYKNSHKKEIVAYIVSMVLKAALLAVTWSGKARKRGLESMTKI